MKQKGFTLVEVLVGVAVFLTVSLSAYKGFVGLLNLVQLTQYKIAAINLVNEQFELIRNLPYADVGVVGGIPNGKLSHTQTLVRSNVSFDVTTTIRNIDLDFDGTIGGTPNDLSPADNKLVEVMVECTSCQNFAPMTMSTRVAPKNLETASTNGALFVKVFDANGIPVSGADVHIVNSSVTPTITIDDTTGNNGILQIVDVPPGVEAYQITVSKSGFSTERTYSSGGGNPNPDKPHATVLLQQVTQISFTIDELSSMQFSSVTAMCTPVASIDFNLSGDKTIRVGVKKYSQAKVTNGSGLLTLDDMEWDAYTVDMTDSTYDLIGLNPLNSIFLNPDTTQNVQLIVAPKDPQALLVTVKDSVTLLPLTDVTVELSKSGFNDEKTTGRGYMIQTDWSGGAGQVNFTSPNQYYLDNGNVDVTTAPGDVRLVNSFGSYISNGIIESSIFDTGSLSNFHQLIWNPTDQATSTGSNSVRFQLASATTTSGITWSYKGPDGTASTYYTYPYSTINTVHDDDRYIRYKLYLTTASPAVTPNLSDVSFTFTSLCTPPGQVMFGGLSNATYTLDVGRSGYGTTSVNVIINSARKEQEILLIPN